MAQKLFKGFKQVTKATFDKAKEANELEGYIWFVRTPLNDAGVAGEGEDTGALGNDDYDIYFGKTQYGHFRTNEISAMATAISTIAKELGLNESYVLDLLRTDDFYETQEGTDMSARDAFMKIADEIVADKKALSDYKIDNDALVKEKAIDIDYIKEGGHFLQLKNAAGEYIGTKIDVADFVADGILDSAKLVEVKDNTEAGEKEPISGQTVADGTYIKLVFNQSGSGVKPPVYVDVKGLIDVYTADETSIHKDETNKFSVKEVKTDITKTNADITIEGGPLAKEFKEAYPDGVLPSGTTMQSLFMKLLCVEKWPTKIDTSDAGHSASIGKPVITMKSGLVEVGSTVSVKVENAVSTHTVTAPKAFGFEYGYSAADDNTRDSANTEIVGTYTDGVLVEASSLEVTIPTKEKQTVAGKVAAKSATLNDSFVAAEGANTVSATNTSSTFTATFDTLPAYYQCSNLKNTHSDEQVAKATSQIDGKTIETTVQTNSSSATVTGVYPIFCNGVQGNGNGEHDANLANGLTAAKDHTKLSLMNKGNETFYVAFIRQAVAAYTLYLPKGRTIKEAHAIDGLKNTYTLPNNASSYTKTGTETIQVQGVGVEYDVYAFAGTQGANGVKFILNSL